MKIIANGIVSSLIKRIIQEKGLKQKAVASKCGFEYSAFIDMLNGRKIICDLDIAVIANVLEVEPNDLFATNTPNSA